MLIKCSFCKKYSEASVSKCQVTVISYVSQCPKITLRFSNYIYLEGRSGTLSAICCEILMFVAYLEVLQIFIEPSFFFLMRDI